MINFLSSTATATFFYYADGNMLILEIKSESSIHT
jgi:hypothetical protein